MGFLTLRGDKGKMMDLCLFLLGLFAVIEAATPQGEERLIG